MDCPKCKLVNPPTAERCDCGYDFTTGTMEQSYLTERDRHLSKPVITGTAVLVLVAIRLGFGLARAAGARGSLAAVFVLILLALAVVLSLRLFRGEA
jgi:hypothetical protein